jgi:hypothetical protein
MKWKPPSSSNVGWKGLSAVQLRDAAFADPDPRFRRDGVRNSEREGFRRVWVQEGVESPSDHMSHSI